MADQEFLASFGVEMDETGLLRLEEALKKTGAGGRAGRGF